MDEAAVGKRKKADDSSWRRATTHGSRRTIHGGKRQAMEHLCRLWNPAGHEIESRWTHDVANVTDAERFALAVLLSNLRPACAIEKGTYKVGSLAKLSKSYLKWPLSKVIIKSAWMFIGTIRLDWNYMKVFNSEKKLKSHQKKIAIWLNFEQGLHMNVIGLPKFHHDFR